MTKEYYEGVLTGLKICKEMWVQGTISHEEIRENEIYYGDLLLEAIREENTALDDLDKKLQDFADKYLKRPTNKN